MRLFTALDLPPDMLLRLDRLLAVLRPEAAIKWSPLDNLHITTKFIGPWSEQHLEPLDAALQRVRFCEPIEIELQDLGWFPNSQTPRVLWAGVRGGVPLADLAQRTDQMLLDLGIPKETHAFSPHLTLARIKSPVPLQRLRAKVEELQAAPIGHFHALHFYLYRSDPGSNASIYRKLRTYSLGPAQSASS